jgi:hypothetical protein
MAIEFPHRVGAGDAISPAASAAHDDPLWYKDAIIYQAHVKAFYDSNNDGIGDFPGLTRRLDYLQGLGITCLWLLPFFPSPLKDDGMTLRIIGASIRATVRSTISARSSAPRTSGTSRS